MIRVPDCEAQRELPSTEAELAGLPDACAINFACCLRGFLGLLAQQRGSLLTLVGIDNLFRR